MYQILVNLKLVPRLRENQCTMYYMLATSYNIRCSRTDIHFACRNITGALIYTLIAAAVVNMHSDKQPRRASLPKLIATTAWEHSRVPRTRGRERRLCAT